MLNVESIINTILNTWSNAVEPKVGDNCSVADSSTISEFPYATITFMGLPTAGSDLEGNELGVTVTVQTDIYTSKQRAVSQGYEIDALSHSALLGLGFSRSYGPEPTQNVDPSIKRLTSRYSRVIGYGDILENKETSG